MFLLCTEKLPIACCKTVLSFFVSINFLPTLAIYPNNVTTVPNLNLQLTNFLDLLIPRMCVCCKQKLLSSEKFICLNCLIKLPLSNDWEFKQNSLHERLLEFIPVEQAAALMACETESKYQQLVYALKYEDRPQLGNYFGEMLGRLIGSNDDLAHADYICPIPLHPKKQQKRGYNQSVHLAQGVAKQTGICFNDTNLVRTVNTRTQTKLDIHERQQNMKGVFRCIDPQLFQDKHIILIDDVVTTGATISSCVYAILPQCNARISVLCLSRII